MMRVAVVIAGLLCATAQAQQRTDSPPARARADAGPTRSDPGSATREDAGSATRQDAGSSDRTLSKEDSDLVKDLALLERMDLLRNLDLFEDAKEPDKVEQRQQ